MTMAVAIACAFCSGVRPCVKCTVKWSVSTARPVAMPTAFMAVNCFLITATTLPCGSWTGKLTSWQPHGQPKQHMAVQHTRTSPNSWAVPSKSFRLYWQQANGSMTPPIFSWVRRLRMMVTGRPQQQQVHLKGRSRWRKGSGGTPSPRIIARSTLNGRWFPLTAFLPITPMIPSKRSFAEKRRAPLLKSWTWYLLPISNPTSTSNAFTISLIDTPSTWDNTLKGSLVSPDQYVVPWPIACWPGALTSVSSRARRACAIMSITLGRTLRTPATDL
mmetsp:Transcript_121110/g.338019  ORF Transcript_121110/g.338019 Transcript_121110/m.338019 type:complete len:274 (+) Transcript_121110:193-1014(+)